MTTRHLQRGFIDVPRWQWVALFVLAVLGLVALLGGAGWGIWWLFTHVRFVA